MSQARQLRHHYGKFQFIKNDILCGESSNPHGFLFVSGVADGVGGWRLYGIDPGEFSLHLMRTCERLVRLGRFVPTNPSDLLANSYYELLNHKKAILGK